MKFTERKQWLYDTKLHGLADTKTALRLHSEYVRAYSPMPPPMFYEVDRNANKVDELWHMPLGNRTVFSREIPLPVIVKSDRPDWRLTKAGIVPQQKHTLWLDNLLLQEADYFPMRGDMVYFNGYRNMIVNVILEPNGFWQQTNLWLGLLCETIIPADGDAKPLINPGSPPPAERIQSSPLPEA